METETETETVIIQRKRTDTLKSVTDRPSRGPAEHPDRIPTEAPAHPVTGPGRTPRRDGPA